MSDRQVRVLLTGGIGAGKSSVGDLLRARGALVIDADEIGHQVLESGGEAYAGVAKKWPSVVVRGRIDRTRLADIVFRDRDQLRHLEELTHMAIRRRIRERVNAADTAVVVVEVPVMTDFMGSGWIRVAVDADEGVRLERLRVRGMELGDVNRRMKSQPTRAEIRDWADFIIDNTGDRSQLDAEVDAFWRRLTGTSRRRTNRRVKNR